MFYRPFTAKAMRVVPLVIALMAIAVLVLPGNSVQAQQAGTVQYNENDDVPVITLTATDPEGASPIVWSLLTSETEIQDIDGDGIDDVDDTDVADHALFDTPVDGVLNFKEAPNYEGTGVDNEYHVVVQASDGTAMNWFKVTVMVMDVEEDGSVKLRPMAQDNTTLLQPQVGVVITAHSLTDPDGESSTSRETSTISTAEYQWYRTSSRTATGTEIDGATTRTYPPTDAAGNSDVGMYLRVVATYTDGGPSRGNKTATAVSEYVTMNRISNNAPPMFPSATTTRAVLEQTPKGGRPSASRSRPQTPTAAKY